MPVKGSAPLGDRIIGALRDAGYPIGPKAIAEAVGSTENGVSQELTKLAVANRVTKKGRGGWTVSDLAGGGRHELPEPGRVHGPQADGASSGPHVAAGEGGGVPSGPSLSDVPTLPVTQYRAGYGAAAPVSEGDAGVTLPVPIPLLEAIFGRRPRAGEVMSSFVRGESMLPWLADGEQVWIERLARFEDGGRYAVHIDGEGETIRRVWREPGGVLVLAPDNPVYRPATLRLRHVEDDTYRDDAGATIRVVVSGRVVKPTDAGRSIHETVIASMRAANGH